MQGQQDGKNEDGTMLLMCAVETARQSHGPLLIYADAVVKTYMTPLTTFSTSRLVCTA